MYSIDDFNFPDKEYLVRLIDHLQKKAEQYQTDADRLITWSGASLNWISDYFTDKNVRWSLETLPVDRIYLTGTGPEWNAIIIDQCERSPQKLRELIYQSDEVKNIFSSAVFVDVPILARYEDSQYKVLDGMHRAVAAIRDEHESIQVYVAYLEKDPHPFCEPHVLYDLLRAYIRGMNRDKKGLIQSLIFLKKSYKNVEPLLRERFNKTWIPSDEIQDIITQVLNDDSHII